VSQIRADAWLRWLDTLPADLGRRAIPADHARREKAAALMAALELPHQELYPWGLEAGHRLWEPWAQARESVEQSAGATEEPGAQADWIVHDREAGTVTFATLAPLPSRCERFARRECPRMAPMGHEPALEQCNYWAWDGMLAAAPHVELFPEWQRFDCHKHYPVFQLHLCGTALSQVIGAAPRWQHHGDAASGRLFMAYAALTDHPEFFEARTLP
jgi:hypothetical protein